MTTCPLCNGELDVLYAGTCVSCGITTCDYCIFACFCCERLWCDECYALASCTWCHLQCCTSCLETRHAETCRGE